MARRKRGSVKDTDQVLITNADLATADVTGVLPVANGGTGSGSYTNGQLLIGNTTGNTLTKATLTAGAGITITNGAGSITIAAGLATNSGSVANNASLVVTHAADSTGVRNCWAHKTTGLTSLLITCNGSNGSTAFPDASSYAHDVTGSGAQVATASAKFGTGGALFTTSNYLSVPDHASLTFGLGDFTIEFWLRLTDLSNYRNIISKGYYAGNGWLLMTQPLSGAMTFYTPSGISVCQESTSIVADTWYHYRVCRRGSTVTIARNGSLTASGNSSANFNGTTPLRIGADGAYHLIGSLDDVHIIKADTGPVSGFSAPTVETVVVSGTKTAMPIVEATGGMVITHVSNTETMFTNKTGAVADILAVVSV